MFGPAKTPAALKALAILAPALWAGTALADAEPVNVFVDRAKVFKIQQPADTVIVGNPMIADVTMHDRFTVVVTGKTAGSTNLIILDKDSKPIIDELINVGPSSTDLVTVLRGTARSTLACAPYCDATAQVGDDKDAFEITSKQMTTRDQMARGAAGGQ
ncbi:pilus assembly protein [Microvirga tunisiensis]|uniref:Pilus assembly protein n=2 Tax=Pannonibacter tanglangensis TaxID=2750084 RepID=A0A7X5JAA8_9HYPH|nr:MULTISPECIES: pilus assembly protein N-terminal domain-containing protein [unclassified Pannonibacter]NBN64665.1 pilus assembly protein [Pannonibacter sp. XCT-34]NBN79200.1 pilus assembly protein [Pannonibacter sp. XCT-53]